MASDRSAREAVRLPFCDKRSMDIGKIKAFQYKGVKISLQSSQLC